MTFPMKVDTMMICGDTKDESDDYRGIEWNREGYGYNS